MRKVIKKIFVVVMLLFSFVCTKNLKAQSIASIKGFDLSNDFKCEFESKVDLMSESNKGCISGWFGLYSFYDKEKDILFLNELSWVYADPIDGNQLKFITQEMSLEFNHQDPSKAKYAENNLCLLSYGPDVEYKKENGTCVGFEFSVGSNGISLGFEFDKNIESYDRELVSNTRNRYRDIHFEYSFKSDSKIAKSHNTLIAYEVVYIPNFLKCNGIEIVVNYKNTTSFGRYSALAVEENNSCTYSVNKLNGGGRPPVIDDPTNPSPYIINDNNSNE